MSFLFSHLCRLFDDLEALETKQPPLLPADKVDRLRCTIQTWFRQRRRLVDSLQAEDTLALLSAFLPECRPDRVYGIQSTSLCRILSRSLNFGRAQLGSLQAYKQQGRGDLGLCLQRVLDKTGPPAQPCVSLKEVDDLLSWLATQCRFSDAMVQAAIPSSSESRDLQVGSIVKRLDGRDAKWLVRLVLKDLSPVRIDERLILDSIHFLLPDLLRFQHDYRAATLALKTTMSAYPSTVDRSAMRLLQLSASSALRPHTGVKVGRPMYNKARSIQHALNMVGQGNWAIERKYDGEYCEIHIDLKISQVPAKCIKIFSKNGKDATSDRQEIVPILVQCLRLGRVDCRILREVILLGELVVWSDLTKTVMPFEEIRKHVTRSGSFLGTKQDSRPLPQEHLCIVFFDLLLLDDRLVLKESVEERRQVLRGIYDKLPGRAKSAEWKILDFSQMQNSKRKLLQQFAASSAMACEGLVLKPCGVPYFSLSLPHQEHNNHGFIKLKKDYIQGLGDEADLAVVGASYDAQEAVKSGIANIRWTHFHLGAITNTEEVRRYGQAPLFKLIGTIVQGPCIPKAVLILANQLGHIAAGSTQSVIDLPFIVTPPNSKIGTVFRTPLVFEVLGSGFAKPPDSDFLMLRHPRVKKLHQDRTWRDCVGFSELQELAIKARTVGLDSESQENRHELARLERSMKKKFDKQLSKTPSPNKSTATLSNILSQQRNPRAVLSEVSNNSRSSELRATSPIEGPFRRSPKRRTAVSLESHKETKRQRAVEKNDLVRPLTRDIYAATRYIPGTGSLSESVTIDNHDKCGAHSSTVRRFCSNQNCVLSKCVVYFSSCVVKTPYVTSDLFECHAATQVASWRHWIRQEQDQSSCASMVGESQAYPGLRRLVISEGRRPHALMPLIQDMLDARLGSSTIEIWDWRMLEMAQEHVTTLEDHQHLLLGTLSWIESEQRLVWTSTRRSS